MKILFASIFAAALMAAPIANAASIGVHVGPIGIGTHIGGHHHHGDCRSWGARHHCRGYW
jgi:hypothetical protein